MVYFLSRLCWEAKVSKQIVVWHNLDVSLPIWPCVKYYRNQSASVPTRRYKIAMQIRFGILPLLVNKNAEGFKTELKSSAGEKLEVTVNQVKCKSLNFKDKLPSLLKVRFTYFLRWFYLLHFLKQDLIFQFKNRKRQRMLDLWLLNIFRGCNSLAIENTLMAKSPREPEWNNGYW